MKTIFYRMSVFLLICAFMGGGLTYAQGFAVDFKV